MNLWNPKNSPLARTMKLTALLAVLMTVCFALLKLETLAITAGTIAYHFLMRLAVGHAFDRFLGNRVDEQKAWFQPRRWEAPLYKWLRVDRWKAVLPTYEPELFDRRAHSWDEIAQAMCQAELVHEVIVLMSFLPLLAGFRLGGMTAFVITSVLAAAFDLLFVIAQRYNRPRVVKIAQMIRARKQS